MIESITAAAAPSVQPAGQSLGQMDSDAFLKLLVAQMRYQNPMEPADGTQMLQQTAQFTQVETLQSMVELQQQLMGFSQISLATSLVGKEVTASTADGSLISGTVESTRFGAAGPLLTIDGIDVTLDQVVTIAQKDE